MPYIRSETDDVGQKRIPELEAWTNGSRSSRRSRKELNWHRHGVENRSDTVHKRMLHGELKTRVLVLYFYELSCFERERTPQTRRILAKPQFNFPQLVPVTWSPNCAVMSRSNIVVYSESVTLSNHGVNDGWGMSVVCGNGVEWRDTKRPYPGPIRGMSWCSERLLR